MAQSAERAAETALRFRRANDLIAAKARELEVECVPFLCECERETCRQTVPLDQGKYAGIRAHQFRFILAPGHENPRWETVVQEGDGYVVVEKGDEAATSPSRSP